MTRWEWTWEERTQTADPPPPERGPASDPSPAVPAAVTPRQLGRFRRRRAIALGCALVLTMVVIATLSGHGGGHSAHRLVTHPPLTYKAPAGEAQAQQARAEKDAIDHVLTYTPVVVEGGARGNEVALTFDDGPGPYTQRLVEVLNSLGVKATFFVVGEEERYFSAATLTELASGDVIGDHTETHPMMTMLSAHDQHEQLFEQVAHIEVLGGPRPRLFRPPYGSFDATTLRELRAFHMLMVLWSTDTRDYTRPGVEAIVQSALAGAHPGAIILMHDAGGDRSQTIAALPAIVRGLRRRGLRPVTVPRLMLDDPPPADQPIPRSLAGD